MADQVKHQQDGPDFQLETAALNSRLDLFAPTTMPIILGFDEAGRGPWAGPVTAAAAWINPDAVEKLPTGLNDSKKLTRIKRTQLFADLKKLAEDGDVFRCAVVSIDAEEIDQRGILPSTFHAMDMAALALMAASSFGQDDQLHMLVDGNLAPSFDQVRARQNHPIAITPVVKGDGRSLSIAAASIMAKETRDMLMEQLDLEFPNYGWASNMGYGTKDHQAALAKQGPTQHHRLTFKPVAAAAAKFGYTR